MLPYEFQVLGKVGLLLVDVELGHGSSVNPEVSQVKTNERGVPRDHARVRKRRSVRSMPSSRVTSKGQVTIPSEVRKALKIEQGDDLLFEVGTDQTARLRVVKRQRLSDLYGALGSARPFPGKEAVRDEVGRSLGERAKGSGA